MRFCDNTGAMYEDFNFSNMSDIDYTDAMSDIDMDAEIEHV